MTIFWISAAGLENWSIRSPAEVETILMNTGFVRDLATRFPGEVPELAVTRPTLEDVYLRMIGDPA